MNLANLSMLRHLIVLLLCLWSTATLAVPKAADQEEDEVTFSDAGAPPRRTTQPYRTPAAGIATPSARPAHSMGKPRTRARSARLANSSGYGKRQVVASQHRQFGKASGRVVKRAGQAGKFQSAHMAGKPGRANAKTARLAQKKRSAGRLTVAGERRPSRVAKVHSRVVKRASATQQARRLDHRRTNKNRYGNGNRVSKPATSRSANRRAVHAQGRR